MRKIRTFNKKYKKNIYFYILELRDKIKSNSFNKRRNKKLLHKYHIFFFFLTSSFLYCTYYPNKNMTYNTIYLGIFQQYLLVILYLINIE